MPFDNDLAKMRAELLTKQPPTYDDGAGMFERSPYAMPVSLFGKTPKPKPKPKPAAPGVSGLPQFDEAPADMQRRSLFGLKAQAPAQLPAVIPQRAPPLMQPAPAPTPAPSMFSAPLQDAASSIANKALNAPVTRRDILRGVGQAALQQVIPMPSVTDVIAPITAPLTEAAQNMFVPDPGIDTYIETYVSNMFSEAAYEEPFAATTSMYDFMRDYLDGRVPQKELNKFDKLKDRVDEYYDNEDESSEKATSAQETLSDFIHEKLKLLKPHELYDVNENLNQQILSPEEFYNYILESRGGEGLEILGAEGFTKYLEASDPLGNKFVPR